MVKKSQEGSYQKRSVTTVNRIISNVGSFFKWLKKEGYIEDNIIIGLQDDIPKNLRNRRPPFDIFVLNRIVHSPLFSGCVGEGKSISVEILKFETGGFGFLFACCLPERG